MPGRTRILCALAPRACASPCVLEGAAPSAPGADTPAPASLGRTVSGLGADGAAPSSTLGRFARIAVRGYQGRSPCLVSPAASPRHPMTRAGIAWSKATASHPQVGRSR
jgi:hypothetical protein